MVGEWPIDVPMIRSPVYLLVDLARCGVPVDVLADVFELDEQMVVRICLHHHVGPKRGAKHIPCSTGGNGDAGSGPRDRPPSRTTMGDSAIAGSDEGRRRQGFLQLSLPPEDR